MKSRFRILNSSWDFVIFSNTIGFFMINSKNQSELREDVVRQLEEKMANLEECTNWMAHAQGIRNIEDFAMKKMRKALKIPEKIQVAHATVVARFIIKYISQYSFPIVTNLDLQSLKSSQPRTDANRIFRLDIIDDEEKIDRIWERNRKIDKEEVAWYVSYDSWLCCGCLSYSFFLLSFAFLILE